MKIYCCGCEQETEARLTDGREIYPRRPDLSYLPFWKCDTCGNYVGCHHKTKDRARPLGCIPTPEIKAARSHIHRLIDPIWQGGTLSRKVLYKSISKELGYRYHTANIKSIEEARKVYAIAAKLKQSLLGEENAS